MRRKKPPWSKEQKVQLDIKRAGAARAVYMGKEELPKVRFELETTDGQLVEFETSLKIASKLKGHLSAVIKAAQF